MGFAPVATAVDFKEFRRERMAYVKVPRYWKFVAVPAMDTSQARKFRFETFRAHECAQRRQGLLVPPRRTTESTSSDTVTTIP